MARQRSGQKRPSNAEAARRSRVAEMQAQARRAEQRRRLLWAGSAIVVVVGLIVALVVTGLSSKKSGGGAAATRQPAPASLVTAVTTVPASTLNTVGAGSVIAPPVRVGPSVALRSGGLPQIIYVGAEYCPHCGAQRWAMVNALSRFGTFSNLSVTRSAAADGNVPTFSFYGSTYTSRYVVFTPTEDYTNRPGNGFYVPLEPLTSLDRSLLKKYQASSIPFIDYGEMYAQEGVQFNDSPLLNSGLTWTDVAQDMGNPSSTIGKAIDGSANIITATICKLTGGNPGSVCTMPGVVAAAAKLK